MKKILTTLLVLAPLVGQTQAAVSLLNGSFETMYEPGTTTWTSLNGGFSATTVGVAGGMGPGATVNGGTGLTDAGATTVDGYGWIDDDFALNDGRTAVTTGNGNTGTNAVSVNGGGWGQPGGLINSMNTGTSGGSAIDLGMFARGATDGLTLELWAGGAGDGTLSGATLLTPTSSVDPVLSGDHQQFSRHYDAATMGVVTGQNLTVRFGIALGGSGAQSNFDDVTLVEEVPEPASMSLLALGGLCLLRRRRSA